MALAAPAVPLRRPGGLLSAAVVAALLACLLLVVSGAAWRVSGGRWAVIETPSMGTAAPVGTLILTRPAPLALLEVGDVVTYRPPNLPGSLVTHRVVAVLADGNLQVQGDVNGAVDPFPVTQDSLVGEVVGHYRGLGWLVRALPTLLLGVVVLVVGSGWYVPLRWRSSVRVLGSCVLVAVTSLIIRPFVHPVLVAVVTTPDGPRATVASGGLLPTRITGTAGDYVDLHAGEVGSVLVASDRPGGALLVSGSPELHGWWLVGMVVVCLLPLLWTLAVGLSPDPGRPAGRTTR
ncbi:S26 family signal peptidase [Microlunatus capsulatus]|uniref:Signal peptidase I n=1 Tax=Microlunatus capsulatus TaxID=99117 RepID=A0ABS4Z244_9ACTN|nr:S26 family signal peptidase [Microlunatus capsulatus]MBP2415113.1 signal peptidase I [Microlunatus capsulatus]